MAKRRLAFRFLLASTFGIWILLIVGSSLLPAPARANPGAEVAAQVKEVVAPVTEPVQETVEQVAPPVTPPPPAPNPPPLQLPQVDAPKPPVERLPEAPVKVPAAAKAVETATKTVGAAPEAASGGAEPVSSAGQRAAAGAQGATGELAAAAQGTVGAAIETTEAVIAAPTAASTGAAAPQGAWNGSTGSDPRPDSGAAPPASAGATADPGEISPKVFPGVPARLLDPFIYVWPAVALLAEGSFGFVGAWSRTVMDLYEEQGASTSLHGEAAPFADSPPTATPAGQPPFSSVASPTLTPFDWVADKSALLGLALFLVLGASTLVLLAVARRELGLPMFRRGNRFPWRH